MGTAPEGRGGYSFLRVILDGIDDSGLIAALEDRNTTGRPPRYSSRVLWRAWLSKYVLSILYDRDLVEELRTTPELREICGLPADSDAVPSRSTISRFTTRLARFTDLVKKCVDMATDMLSGELPDLGYATAVDSSAFEAHANPNRKIVADPDAKWGAVHSSRAKDGDTEWVFGYKLHMISDADHGVPLDFFITPANFADTDTLPDILVGALDKFPWLKPKYLIADRGYDSLPNHKDVLEAGVVPIIHVRMPTARDGLYDGLYDSDGRLTCMGSVMEYVRTDPESGFHLFRCPAEGCELKKRDIGRGGSILHCDSEVWVDPMDNPRAIGVVARASEEWKRQYDKRMSIERIFRSLKHSRLLESHRFLSMAKIVMHATVSVLTYQATVLARLRIDDLEGMRQMRILGV